MDYEQKLRPVFQILASIMNSARQRRFESDVTSDIQRANMLLLSGKSKLMMASRLRRIAPYKLHAVAGWVKKQMKQRKRSASARGRGATPNTPTRGRGWRKRDDSLRAALRCARNIVAGSKKDRSAIPDSDPKVNGSPVRAPLRRSGAAFFESEQSDSIAEDDSFGPVTP